MSNVSQIIKASCELRSDFSDKSSIETECLYGEVVKIIKIYKNKVNVELLSDKYNGWINIEDIGILPPPTHHIIAPRTFLYETNDIKSKTFGFLSLGSRVACISFSNEWSKISNIDGYPSKVFFIKSNSILPLNCFLDDWVLTAEHLQETPYRWGGKNSLGIDCSALLQLSLNSGGINIPRNTYDQVKVIPKNIDGINSLNRGNIVFWDRHVGIMINNKDIIHANAYHMKTCIEPLKKVLKRDPKILAIKSF